jgi:hypothetical protein
MRKAVSQNNKIWRKKFHGIFFPFFISGAEICEANPRVLKIRKISAFYAAAAAAAAAAAQ